MVKQTVERYLAPTAPIGMPVVYYQQAKPEDPVAATVVKIERAGQLTLELHLPFKQMREFRRGVVHVGNPRVVGTGEFNGEMAHNGSWDFICAEMTPRGAMELARREYHLAQEVEKDNAERQRQAQEADKVAK